MFIGDEKRTVSIMLYSTQKLRKLWGQLVEQVDITNKRFEKINNRLEEVRSKLQKHVSKNSLSK